MLNSENIALVFGISGGIGGNIYNQLKKKGYKVYGVSRTTEPNSNIISDKYLKDFSQEFIEQNIKIKIFINTIGFLHDKSFSPEKKQKDIFNERTARHRSRSWGVRGERTPRTFFEKQRKQK